jgi:hypothetical protein
MAITIIHAANAPEMRLHCIKGAHASSRFSMALLSLTREANKNVGLICAKIGEDLFIQNCTQK